MKIAQNDNNLISFFILIKREGDTGKSESAPLWCFILATEVLNERIQTKELQNAPNTFASAKRVRF